MHNLLMIHPSYSVNTVPPGLRQGYIESLANLGGSAPGVRERYDAADKRIPEEATRLHPNDPLAQSSAAVNIREENIKNAREEDPNQTRSAHLDAADMIWPKPTTEQRIAEMQAAARKAAPAASEEEIAKRTRDKIFASATKTNQGINQIAAEKAKEKN